MVSLLARGYRLDTKSFTLRPKGLFVVTSTPDGAQILINNKLESATNATLPLPPDTYEVEVKKEGYHSWKKQITIEKEEVTKIDTYLFPLAPSLSAITFTGASNPTLSPDGTKIAYGVIPNDKAESEKIGIWIIDLTDLPIGFLQEPRKITDLDPTGITWRWAPDGRQMLLAGPPGFFLIDTNQLTSKTQVNLLTDVMLAQLTQKWQENEDKKNQANFETLPEKLQQVLEAENIVFSPDATKILYTSKADVTIPPNLKAQLPGSSTQKEERNTKNGRTYVYDIKEDRNFLIYDHETTTDKKIFEEASAAASILATDQKRPIVKKTKPTPTPTSLKNHNSVRWFPSSSHIVLAEPNQVTIMDYDGTNKINVWSGLYNSPFALPSPNHSRLIILTNLGAGNSTPPNLYSISLR